jgi:hypothetical protein
MEKSGTKMEQKMQEIFVARYGGVGDELKGIKKQMGDLAKQVTEKRNDEGVLTDVRKVLKEIGDKKNEMEVISKDHKKWYEGSAKEGSGVNVDQVKEFCREMVKDTFAENKENMGGGGGGTEAIEAELNRMRRSIQKQQDQACSHEFLLFGLGKTDHSERLKMLGKLFEDLPEQHRPIVPLSTPSDKNGVILPITTGKCGSVKSRQELVAKVRAAKLTAGGSRVGARAVFGMVTDEQNKLMIDAVKYLERETGGDKDRIKMNLREGWVQVDGTIVGRRNDKGTLIFEGEKFAGKKILNGPYLSRKGGAAAASSASSSGS